MRSRCLRLAPLLLLVALMTPTPNASAALTGASALTQSSTPALACLARFATPGCAVEEFLDDVGGVNDIEVVGPDVYVLLGNPNTAFPEGRLLRLRRDGATYDVLQCFSDQMDTGCTTAPLLTNATSLAVGDDRVYVGAAYLNNNQVVGALTFLPRDSATGALSAPTACRAAGATTTPTGCTTGDPLRVTVADLALTPDGSALYVSVTDQAQAESNVLAYDLDGTGMPTGAPSCLSSLATDTCTAPDTDARGDALKSLGLLDVSADGRHVYGATGGGVVALTRTTSGPAVNDVGFGSCLSSLAAVEDVCAAFPPALGFVTAIDHAGAQKIALTLVGDDGPGGTTAGGVVVLSRNAATGALTLGACRTGIATTGCTTDATIGDGGAGGLAPDGSVVHLVASGQRVLTYGVGAGTLVKLAGTAGCLAATASSTCTGGLRGVDDTVLDAAVTSGQLVVGGLGGLAFFTRSTLTDVPEVATPKPARTLRPDARRTVRIPVRCTGDAACKGTLTLSSTKKVRPAPSEPPRIITFATGRLTVTAGRTGTVELVVSRANAAVLRRLSSVACTVTAKVGSTRRTARTTLTR